MPDEQAQAVGAFINLSLTALFVVLKLSGVIAWSWLWVLCPILIPLTLGIIAGFIAGFIIVVKKLVNENS